MTINKGIQNLIFNILKIKKDNVAFIFDKDFEPFVDDITGICRETGCALTCEKVIFDGKTLPSKISEILLDAKHEIVLFGLKENVWHFNERQKAKSELKKRLVSLACYHDRIIEEGYYDSTIILSLAKDLESYFKEGDRVLITSENGTSLEAEIGQKFVESGDYSNIGTGGDFPSGEVGFGPKEESVNGCIVYDSKIQHIGLVSKLKVTVEKDRIIKIEGKKKNEMEKLIKRDPILNLISEISIGINPFIKIKDEPSVLEEKKLGTAHFGHGGNLSYGKRRGLHFDAVISAPSFKIGNNLILDKGKINVTCLSADTKKLIEKTHKID